MPVPVAVGVPEAEDARAAADGGRISPRSKLADIGVTGTGGGEGGSPDLLLPLVLLLFRQRFLIPFTLTMLWLRWVCAPCAPVPCCCCAALRSSASESVEKRLEGVADALPLSVGGAEGGIGGGPEGM